MNKKALYSLFFFVLGTWATLFAFTAMGICNPHPGFPWDGDGGATYDYSRIPRLKWMGPGKPDTFQEYQLLREEKPFSIRSVYFSDRSPTGGLVQKAMILVNEGLYSSVQTKLIRYATDLEDDGYSVEVYTTSGGTPQELKTFIKDHSTDLVGCVFVGDLPAAWYELEVWGHEEFPCDLYYMDLDGRWIDNDSDGMWDGHTAGSGDQGPEIFIGHIDASMMTGNEAALTNQYLDKNHAYRHGEMFVPGFALTYTEDDWAIYTDIRTDIHYAYPSFQDIAAPNTNRDDYVDNRVPNADYEFVQLACHSGPTGHAFTRGGWAWNSEIKAAVPFAMFFNLFACSSLRFTVADFLGGSYIYNASQTSLSVIGSTKTGSMLVFWAFYQPFGAYETYGEAFRQWFNHLAPYNNDEKAWHFGMTIAGDPFLFKQESPTIKEVFPSYGTSEGGTEVTLTGSYFTNTQDTQVFFGGIAATDVAVLDGGTITCTTPPSPEAGFVDVIVVNSKGTGTLKNGYEYFFTLLEIYSVTPDRGPQQGGNLVTVAGDYFTDATYIFFGIVLAQDISCVDRYTITCLPPGGSGTVDVLAMEGGKYDILTGGYTYVEPPEISQIHPDYGHVLGGEPVTITGINFTTTEDTEVEFGGVPAPWINVIDPNTLEATTPPHPEGQVNVTVTNSYGTAALSNGFEYLDKPVLFFLGGDLTPGSPVAFRVKAPDRPNQNLCLLVNNQLGPTTFPNLGITIDLALAGLVIRYNSFGGSPSPDLNEAGERTCVVNVPSYPPGWIYWQVIVGTLSPPDLAVSNRVDLQIPD